MPAQGGGATGRDGPEGAVLPPGQALGLLHHLAMGADDLRELDPARRSRRAHGLRRRREVAQVQPLQGRGGGEERPAGEVEIAHGAPDAAVPQEPLDRVEIDPRFQEMRGEGVPVMPSSA